ncbi:MAG: hypothetical protein ACK5MN_00420 [Lachnospiraceae bacterium]
MKYIERIDYIVAQGTGGGFGALMNGIKGWALDNLIPIAVTAISVVIMMIGFSFFLGRKGREWGKEQILWTIAGAAFIYTSTQIATSVAAAFGF